MPSSNWEPALVAAITFDKRALSRGETPPERHKVKLDDLVAWLEHDAEKREKEIYARTKGQHSRGVDPD